MSFDKPGAVRADVVTSMIEVLRHRGPDDQGVWTDGIAALANRRLAVIDLSPRGHQPMGNEDGSVQVAFNGEIYNFQELQERLCSARHRLISNSDTETLVHGYEEEGEEWIRRLRGMFAIAIWDRRHRRLLLARDRLGKKPLFYAVIGRTLVFGSEIKALLQHPAVEAIVDPEAVHHYLTFGYVPGPWSAFRGIRKLAPAHYLLFDERGLQVRRYWQLEYRPKYGTSEPQLVEEFSALMHDAVRLRMISDVPVGALLSGGLDSATVVAFMQRAAAGRARTFSIGFEQEEYDELKYARQVAQQFGTDHHECIVRPDAIASLPKILWHYNEPFADSSAVPSLAVSEMARNHVTVALNGDGGDETFLGYDRYLAARLSAPLDRLPGVARRTISAAARLLPRSRPKGTVYRLRRLAEALPLPAQRRYAQWMVYFDNPAKETLYTPEFRSAIGANDSLRLLDEAYERSGAADFVERTAHADIQTYLPDDLLVKMDIASMAASLEVRSPFLDHKVVEFAARIPVDLKLRGVTQKYLVRRAMRDVLPPAILKRSKMGFAVPLEHWFRNELRPLVYDIVLSDRAVNRGYFNRTELRRYADEHMTGVGFHHFRLWNLLILELWHRMFIDARCPTSAPLTV